MGWIDPYPGEMSNGAVGQIWRPNAAEQYLSSDVLPVSTQPARARRSIRSMCDRLGMDQGSCRAVATRRLDGLEMETQSIAAGLFWREVMTCNSWLTLVVCLSLVLAGTGHAQISPFYTFGANEVSLNNADFGMLIDAANGLLLRPRLAKGASASWRNDQTGSHGTISVTKTFHRGSMLCHTLSYETIPTATPSGSTTVVLNWCKTSDGSWRTLS
jgi:hypothetical protein